MNGLQIQVRNTIYELKFSKKSCGHFKKRYSFVLNGSRTKRMGWDLVGGAADVPEPTIRPAVMSVSSSATQNGLLRAFHTTAC